MLDLLTHQAVSVKNRSATEIGLNSLLRLIVVKGWKLVAIYRSPTPPNTPQTQPPKTQSRSPSKRLVVAMAIATAVVATITVVAAIVYLTQ